MQVDHVAGPPAGVRRGEAAVPGRVPVLRGHDQVEPVDEAVDDRHDGVAVRHGQRPAGQEVVLHVDDDQGGRHGQPRHLRTAMPSWNSTNALRVVSVVFDPPKIRNTYPLLSTFSV